MKKVSFLLAHFTKVYQQVKEYDLQIIIITFFKKYGKWELSF